MYETKIRAAALLTTLALLTMAVPQSALAGNNNGEDCDYCWDLECDVGWIEVLGKATVAITLCTVSTGLVAAGGMVCSTVLVVVATQNRERLEDCSNQDEFYDDCTENEC